MKFNRKLATALGLLAASAMFTACGPEPGSNSECESGEVRTQPPGQDLGCYTECAGQSECDTGEECKQFNGGQISICVEGTTNGGCTEDSECATGETCDNGTCVTGGCTADSECGTGEVCTNGSCVTDTSCTADDECGTGEVCTNGACVNGPGAEVQACEAYCQNIFGSCVKNTCTGLDATDTASLDASYEACLNGGTAQDGSVINPCTQDYLADPTFASQVDQLGAETCGSSAALTGVYCGSFGFGEKCDCVEPTIGAACAEDGDCEGGTLTPICIPETNADTGEATGFTGGYCVAGPCDAGSTQAGAIAVGTTTGCGTDGMCMNEQGQQGVTSICYDLCSTNADCRDDYACEVLGFFTDGTAAGRCQPACDTNADCPVYTLTADPNTQLESFCNADKWCEFPCNPNEADSCGDGGQLTCTMHADFNVDNDFKGSCSVAGN